MLLFNRRSHNARYTYAVTTHFQRLGLPLFVQILRPKGSRVFGAQLKNMADFYAPANFQAASAIRAFIASDDIPNVRDLRLGQIPAEIDTGVMKAIFIRATYKIA